ALRLWPQHLPKRLPADLVKELYFEENKGLAEPSGSQDMVGLLYPGVSRLDYDASHEGGVFPRHIESNTDAKVARWIERVINIVPVAPRPPGYNPLEQKNLDRKWILELGGTGKDCFDAIVAMD